MLLGPLLLDASSPLQCIKSLICNRRSLPRTVSENSHEHCPPSRTESSYRHTPAHVFFAPDTTVRFADSPRKSGTLLKNRNRKSSNGQPPWNGKRGGHRCTAAGNGAKPCGDVAGEGNSLCFWEAPVERESGHEAQIGEEGSGGEGREGKGRRDGPFRKR